MALMAEQLVEEWLNRAGYFTIRGLRVGVNEIDLLAIKPKANGYEAKHIEVSVSFRPMSYLGKLTKDEQVELNVKSASSAKKRSEKIVKSGIKNWIEKKFQSKKKKEMREAVLPNVEWKYGFVHGLFHVHRELEHLKDSIVECIPFRTVIEGLIDRESGFTGGAGTDISEMIKFYTGRE